MTALRSSAERLAKLGRYAVPGADRRLECEKAAARLQDRASHARADKEDWNAFLQRIGVIDG